MTRPRKQTVDYFPHQCRHGKTMFILEQQFGNNGYAFWFKTLEILGETEGHCIDCQELPSWKYLLSRTHLDHDQADEILNLLADLGAIDHDLWKMDRKIWSDHFIEGLAFAYRNREVVIPTKPVILRKESGICRDMPDNPCKKSANEMKVNEMKVNETNTPLPPKGEKRKKRLAIIYAADFLEWYGCYPLQVKKAEAAKIWAQLKAENLLPELATLIEAVEKHKRSPDWRNDGGKYIPHPNNWLKQQRWSDKLGSGNGRGSPLSPTMQALVDWNADQDRKEEIIDVESADIQ